MNTTHNPDSVFFENITLKRCLAGLMDYILVFILSVLASILTLGIGFFIFAFLFFGIGMLYRMTTIGSRGSTWGMRAMGIEIKGHDLEPVSGIVGTLHAFTTMLIWTTFILIPINLLSSLLSSQKQGLADHTFGTVITRH